MYLHERMKPILLCLNLPWWFSDWIRTKILLGRSRCNWIVYDTPCAVNSVNIAHFDGSNVFKAWTVLHKCWAYMEAEGQNRPLSKRDYSSPLAFFNIFRADNLLNLRKARVKRLEMLLTTFSMKGSMKDLQSTFCVATLKTLSILSSTFVLSQLLLQTRLFEGISFLRASNHTRLFLKLKNNLSFASDTDCSTKTKKLSKKKKWLQ